MTDGQIRLLVLAAIAVAVLAGVLAASRLQDRARHLAMGIGAVALIAIGGLYVALRPMITAEPEAPQRYVAYFENAGGLEPGDVVRIKGRRAGRVVGADVVQRDGKVMVRVEFEIAPGSGSQWLKQGGIPSDSVLSVRKPALLGRPSLSIDLGDADKIIEVGGEWSKTRSASSQDQFESWLSQLRDFDQKIEQYLGYVKPEQIAEVKLRIAQLRLDIERIRTNVDAAVAQAPELVRRIDELAARLVEIRKQFSEGTKNIPAQVESMNTKLSPVAAQLDEAEKSFVSLREQIGRFDESLRDMVERGEQGEFSKAMRDFRKLSAQLRAGAVRAEYNPKQAGDMPPWRLSRRYFNGGTSTLESAETAEKGGAIPFNELPPAPKPRRTEESQNE